MEWSWLLIGYQKWKREDAHGFLRLKCDTGILKLANGIIEGIIYDNDPNKSGQLPNDIFSQEKFDKGLLDK